MSASHPTDAITNPRRGNVTMRLIQKRSILLLTAAIAVLAPIAGGEDEQAGHDHDLRAATAGEHAEESPAEHGEDEKGEEHADEVALSEEAIRIFNVTTERAERRLLTGTTSVPARVAYNAEAMAHIGTQVQGRAREIVARLGDEVRAGDLLLVIDSPELGMAQSDYLQQDAAVAAARINVEAARSMVQVAATAFERAEKLRASNGISITDFLERQGAMREAEANVRRAEAEVKVAESARLAAENQLHILGYLHEACASLLKSGEIDTRHEIRAPIAGRVIQREVTPGEVVAPESEPLMVLANMEELWVLADVPERHLGRVSVGTPARVSMGSLGDIAFEGTVSYIAPQLDPRTRTAPVRVVIPSTAAPRHEQHAGEEHDVTSGTAVSAVYLLRPGMFGLAELSLASLAGQPQNVAVLAVPEAAIQEVEGGPALFVPVEGEPNTFALRPVRLGARVGHWLPVLSGLAEGDEFVATGTFVLKAELGKEGAEHAH